MEIVLQRYGNREYRLTQQDLLKPQKKVGDKSLDRKAEKYAQAVVDTYVLQQNLDGGLVGDCSIKGDRLVALQEWDVRRGLQSLDIINEFRQIARNSRRRGGWGFQAKPSKFTKNARHRLLEAGAVIDQEFGLNCYEVSLTLPGSGHQAFQCLANWSGWLCDRLLREVRRNTQTSHWFYVWERQKRGALHMHFAIAASDINDAKKAAQKLEYDWFELLLELEAKTGVELFRKNPGVTWRDRPEKWQSHVAPISKSCAAYFSKYASKSTNSASGTNNKYFPARWWGSSRAIKRGIELRRERYKFEGSREYCSQVFEYLCGWLEQIGSIKSYSYKYDLGVSKTGTSLGGGEVYINYYNDEDFQRLQNWEPYVVEHCFSLGEHDADIDSSYYAGIPFMLRRHYKTIADKGMSAQTSSLAHTPPPSPRNQPSSSKGKLSKTSGIQAEPTLVLRARLLQSLAGGDGVKSPRGGIDSVINEQLELFDTSLFL